jgi:hypothetical protein
VAAAAHTGYNYCGHSTQKYLYKYVAGSQTTLTSTTSAGFSVSDDVRIETEGTTITPVLNGSTDSDLGAQTDSSISSGSAGVGGFSDTSSNRIDDWEGGNLAGAGETLSIAIVPTDSSYDIAKPIIVG